MHTSRLFAVACSLCLCLCAVTFTGPAAAQPPTPVANQGGELDTALPSRKVSFSAKNCRLTACLRFIAAETRLPVLSDAYPDDPTHPEITLQDVPLNIAVPRLAQLFGREVVLTGSAVVLRHAQWAVKHRTPNPVFVWRTAPAGKGVVAGVPNASGGKDIRAELFEATAGVLARAVTTETGVAFVIERPLSERRISLVASASAAETLAKALSTLLNGDTRISIGQDKNRIAQEALIVQAMQDERTEAHRLSDDLRKDLAGILSDDQKKAIANGDQIKLPFDQLPKPIRAKAEKYLDLRWRNLVKGVPDFENRMLDPAKGYALSIDLQAVIGLDVVLDDGTRLGF